MTTTQPLSALFRIGDVITVGENPEKRLIVHLNEENVNTTNMNFRKGNFGSRGVMGIWHPTDNPYKVKAIDVPASELQVVRLRRLRDLDLAPARYWSEVEAIAPQVILGVLNVLYLTKEAPKMKKARI